MIRDCCPIGVSEMSFKDFSKIKDSEEKRFMAQDAAHTLIRAEKIKIEAKEIRANKELMKAVRPELAEIAKRDKEEAKSAQTAVNKAGKT